MAFILAGICLGSGCASHNERPSADSTTLYSVGLEGEQRLESVDAVCLPPIGWQAVPLKKSVHHTHQLWLSPSGKTAYGVICFVLPLPVSPNFVLPYFISEIRRTEGRGELTSRKYDSQLDGIRFVADGGLYRTRAYMVTRGFRGWAVYAGTIQGEPIDQNELDLAERAREHTRVGLSAEPPADR